MRHTITCGYQVGQRKQQINNEWPLAGCQLDAVLRSSHRHRGACLAAWAHAERVHAAFGALAVSNVRGQPVLRHRQAPLAALHACSAGAVSQHHKQLDMSARHLLHLWQPQHRLVVAAMCLQVMPRTS